MPDRRIHRTSPTVPSLKIVNASSARSCCPPAGGLQCRLICKIRFSRYSGYGKGAPSKRTGSSAFPSLGEAAARLSTAGSFSALSSFFVSAGLAVSRGFSVKAGFVSTRLLGFGFALGGVRVVRLAGTSRTGAGWGAATSSTWYTCGGAGKAIPAVPQARTAMAKAWRLMAPKTAPGGSPSGPRGSLLIINRAIALATSPRLGFRDQTHALDLPRFEHGDHAQHDSVTRSFIRFD